MDSTFWDLNVSSPRNLEGSARSIPGEPLPLDGARASRVLRIQQLSLLGNGFPLGIIPSYGPTAHKELGSFALQTLLLKPAISNWYVLLMIFYFILLFSCFVLCLVAGKIWGMETVIKVLGFEF
jgi:hypothetical protein